MNEGNKKLRPAQPRPLTKKRCESKRINASGTQVASYHDEERRGRISKRQTQILRLLQTREAITCCEAATILGTYPSNLTAAFRNLEDSGKLVVRREKINPATNKPVMLYELASTQND